MELLNERYLSIKQLSERYGLTPDGIYKKVRRGQFPAGVHFGKVRRWALSELAEWEAAQRA